MSQIKILVVEDEKIVAEDIRDRLFKLGYDVPAVAITGEEAIERATSIQPDVILMDIRLKGPMDGTEAARRILALFDIPIIYLTAYADDETLHRAIETGPYGYLLKPVESRELHTSIEMAYYKHKMEKKVKESEQWLSTTLKSIGDAVIATDAKGHVKFMNPVAERLTGWSQEEALGRQLTEVFNDVASGSTITHGSDVVSALREINKLDVGEQRIVVARNGTEIPIEDNVSAIRDPQGNVTGIVVVFKDATNRQRVEDALKNISRRILEAQETERRRVARELHDSVIQMLSSVKYRLNMFEETMLPVDRKLERNVKKVKEILEKSIQEVRRISRNLRPSELDDLGLIPAIKDACDEFQDRTCLSVSFHHDATPIQLSPDVVLAVYRVFQESLANVEKHARAKRIEVLFATHGDRVRLSVKDNGRGFDPNSPRMQKLRQSGMGFVDMLERAEFVYGTLVINSSVGHGTEVILEVPLNNQINEGH